MKLVVFVGVGENEGVLEGVGWEGVGVEAGGGEGEE